MSDSAEEAAGGCIGYIIGIAIVLYIVYVIVCFTALIAAVVLSATAVIGLLWGICRSTYNFSLALKENLFARSGQIEDNSYVSFFDFSGDGFRNIGRVCKETYARNMRDLFQQRGGSSGCAAAVMRFVFKAFHFIAILLATIAYLPILSVFFTVLYLLIWMMYVSMTLEMRVLEWIIIKVHGLFNICRHCHQRIDLPIYKCPKCGTEYPKLISSVKFGPFFRRCRCGEYLPASRFFGRNDLPSICPHPNCRCSLQSQDVVPVSIAVLGGPSVGKSHFMMDALYLLKNTVLPSMHRSCNVPNTDKPIVDNLVRLYEMGISPQGTRDSMIEAICLEMKAAGWAFPQRLYLYDPPGESFKDSKKVSSHKYYQNMKAAVLIIDPFTLDSVLADYERYGVEHTMMQRGAMTPEESIERWLISMERDFSGIVKHSSCAVVINKTDEPSFAKIAGLRAGASSAKCRDFLHRYDCDNLMNTLEAHFRRVEFFAVSSVGDGGNGAPFKPEGIDEVLRWLMDNI